MFNLRGNGRTSGERCRQEGEPLFAAHGGTGGSLTPISITLLVKKPNYTGKAQIYYHDIGMYLKRKEKLARLENYKSILSPKVELTSITPNEDGDWINKRSKIFETYIPIEPESKFNPSSKSVFTVNSRGLETSRDNIAYNFSRFELEKNISFLIDSYNKQLNKFKLLANSTEKNFLFEDKDKIVWTRATKNNFFKGRKFQYDNKNIKRGIYRPFFKQFVYLSKECNEYVNQWPRIFPTPQSKNLVICCSGNGANTFSTIITDCIPDLHILESGTQCFPLYYYEDPNDYAQRTLFDNDDNDYVRRDGISDFMLERCRQEFGYKITKEDVFYYIYGLLHSKQYRQKFSADLKKMLPRIPLLKDFWTFSKSGRELAALHLNYEKLEPTNLAKVEMSSENYTVEKIRFPQKNKKDTIIYNPYITISNIPLNAYDYAVNGKSPIEWLMERYQLTNDSVSQITNNPNLWCNEQGDKKYIFNLLLRLITLSIATMDIVNNLPDISSELK